MTDAIYDTDATREIRIATAACCLGSVLVAQSRKGVRAIWLGDDPKALVRNSLGRFPGAKVVTSEEFGQTMAWVVAAVDGPGRTLGLRLDVRGTAFQRRVWQALQRIPVGKTASYAEIAKRIGVPRGARAVAGACAANELAVAIPCHRVVRTDGSLSGYRWGVATKARLLEAEQAYRASSERSAQNRRRARSPTPRPGP